MLLPRLITCWNYEVIGSQRSYLKGSINNRDAVDAVDVYIDCMQSFGLVICPELSQYLSLNSDSLAPVSHLFRPCLGVVYIYSLSPTYFSIYQFHHRLPMVLVRNLILISGLQNQLPLQPRS